MRVTLIGMSNIGKSFWARRIAAAGKIERIACDRLIEARLQPELAGGGYQGLRAMAQWMGQPDDARYEENSARYMACEQAVMGDIVNRLRDQADAAMVVDTSGSVIYSGAEIIAGLRDLTRVLYLQATDAHIEAMMQRYMAHPKPLIWGESWSPRQGESGRQSFARCYGELLRDRARRYAAMAHVTIPYERHRAPDMDIGVFLA